MTRNLHRKERWAKKKEHKVLDSTRHVATIRARQSFIVVFLLQKFDGFLLVVQCKLFSLLVFSLLEVFDAPQSHSSVYKSTKKMLFSYSQECLQKHFVLMACQQISILQSSKNCVLQWVLE